MNSINLTNEIKNGMLKALSDFGNSFKSSSFPMDEEEINSIIQDTLTYLNEEENK